MLAKLRGVLAQRHASSRRMQANLDFGVGCTLLEVHENITAGLSDPSKVLE